MEQGVVKCVDRSTQICLAGPTLIHMRQLPGGCDLITGDGHSPILRAQDPLVVVEVVAEMLKETFSHGPDSSAHSSGAIIKLARVDAGLHEPELEVHEQHRIAVVVEARIQKNNFQSLAAQEPFQHIAYGPLNLR